MKQSLKERFLSSFRFSRMTEKKKRKVYHDVDRLLYTFYVAAFFGIWNEFNGFKLLWIIPVVVAYRALTELAKHIIGAKEEPDNIEISGKDIHVKFFAGDYNSRGRTV